MKKFGSHIWRDFVSKEYRVSLGLVSILPGHKQKCSNRSLGILQRNGANGKWLIRRYRNRLWLQRWTAVRLSSANLCNYYVKPKKANLCHAVQCGIPLSSSNPAVAAIVYTRGKHQIWCSIQPNRSICRGSGCGYTVHGRPPAYMYPLDNKP
jgi:hypothetical protein